MIWVRRITRVSGTVLLLSSIALCAAAEVKDLKFDEVFSVIEKNLTGSSKGELEKQAALALIKELGPNVQLVEPGKTNAPQSESGATLSKKAVYQDSYGYLQIAKFEPGLAAAFQEGFRSLVSSNKLKGLVIDLRFTTGQDYDEAAKVADLFMRTERDLLSWGGKTAKSTAKSEPIKLPVAVLVNEETAGGAEALAAIIREAEIGIIIGGQTAGQARVFEDFKLSTGQQLRIGKVPVQLAGGQAIPPKGLTPDIAVDISLEDEKFYYRDPFKPLPRGLSASLRAVSGANNSTADSGNKNRRVLNEAELVRRHREGVEFDANAPGGPEENGKLVSTVTDPALARGLDFLKGLSVLQQFKSSL